MLRSGCDVSASYQDYEELRKMRQAYVVHLLDHVLKERHQVHLNDMAIQREEQPEEHAINVKNVFEIAKQMEGEDSDSLSDSDGEEEPVQTTEMIKGERIKQAVVNEMPED